jgi:hypothetical protein
MLVLSALQDTTEIDFQGMSAGELGGIVGSSLTLATQTPNSLARSVLWWIALLPSITTDC